MACPALPSLSFFCGRGSLIFAVSRLKIQITFGVSVMKRVKSDEIAKPAQLRKGRRTDREHGHASFGDNGLPVTLPSGEALLIMPDDVLDKPSDGRAKNGNHHHSRKNLRPGSPPGGHPGAGRHGVQMPQKRQIGEALKVLLADIDPATGQSYAEAVAMAMIQTATSATSRNAVAAAIFIRDTTEGPPKKFSQISGPDGGPVQVEDAKARLIAKLMGPR